MTTLAIPHYHLSSCQRKVTELFSIAGISVNGTKDYDIQVSDPRFFQRVLADGSLGLGESYVAGWWDCRRLDIFFTKILRARLDQFVPRNITYWITQLEAKFFDSKFPEELSVSFHYDIGNDLFMNMLDKRLTYTCGYWKDAFTLDEAQEAKLDLICRKLYLQPGMNVLDIGCGWGSFAYYAAEKYNVAVTGITLSKSQLVVANELGEGLPVKFELKDYREVEGQYDRIVSLGMFEHVGLQNYRTYFEAVDKRLKPNGIFLLHTIGANVPATTTDPWIEKYIFPGSLIPSISQISTAYEGIMILEDFHNFGKDYDITLMAWYENLTHNLNKIKNNYTGKFLRMWQYYLLSCAASFRARKNQLWQFVFSKGLPEGYQPVR